MVTIAFVAFRTRTEAEELGRRANNIAWNGRTIISSGGGGMASKQQWRWQDLAPEFVNECFSREMARYAARHGGAEGGPPPPSAPLAARLGGPAPSVSGTSTSSSRGQAVPLPPHLASALFGLYTTNIPENDLIGLALIAPEHARGGKYRSVWLAFNDSRARDKAKHLLYGSRFPGSHMKLWVEHAEHASAKSGADEMSKDYRRLHASEYQQAHHTSLPDSPQSAPAHRFEPPVPQQGQMFASPLQPATFTAPVTEYHPNAMPAYPSPAPSMITTQQQQQQQQTEAYSPMQPGLGLLVPRPQAAFVGGSAQSTVHSSAPPQDEPASSPAKLAGSINPARLAMLQAALNERGGAVAAVEISERPDAAEEKKMVEETTRNAWGARKSQPAPVESTGAAQQRQALDAPQQDPAMPQATAPSAAAESPSNSPQRTLSVKGLASLGNSASPPKPASPLPSVASMTSALAHIPSLAGSNGRSPTKGFSISPRANRAVTAAPPANPSSAALSPPPRTPSAASAATT